MSINPKNTQPAFGQNLNEKVLTDAFLPSPGQFLVQKTLQQMALVPQFVALFGPYTKAAPGNQNNQQRWADYQRFDWTVRQLPAINVFESQVEDKESDQAYLNGTITFQIFWPPNFRRGDLARVPATFKGIMQNFFASKFVNDMLDPLYYLQNPAKVYGLNAYGRQMNWNPETEGIIEGDMVPITVVEAKYRIDLRSWYRALEFFDRTKDNPFQKTLADLTKIGGEYDGVDDNGQTQVVINDEITVENP